METMASSNSEKCQTPLTREAERAMNAAYTRPKQAIATGNQRTRQRRAVVLRARAGVVVGSVDARVALMGGRLGRACSAVRYAVHDRRAQARASSITIT